MSASAMADKLVSELNNTFGGRHQSLQQQEIVMTTVEQMMEEAGADFVDRHESVDFSGMHGGERVFSTADVAFAYFGEGKDKAWVAFIFLADGWANAKRPLTQDTAAMGWLDSYIIGEFAG